MKRVWRGFLPACNLVKIVFPDGSTITSKMAWLSLDPKKKVTLFIDPTDTAKLRKKKKVETQILSNRSTLGGQ
ncbi:hypothetical protein Gasu2_05060 [Galdieria sulphuraria]|nr:hypothetical protein Gasu2_05060 [Galdieria sulphuraria]